MPSVSQAIQRMNQTGRSRYVSHRVLVEDSRQHRRAGARDARKEVECFVHVGILAGDYERARAKRLELPEAILVHEVRNPTCAGLDLSVSDMYDRRMNGGRHESSYLRKNQHEEQNTGLRHTANTRARICSEPAVEH